MVSPSTHQDSPKVSEKAVKAALAYVETKPDAERLVARLAPLLATPDPVLSDEERVSVVVDFLVSWRFCPVATTSNPSRSCLEDAAKQLLAALPQPPAGEVEDRYHSALQAIRGPEDSGPWIIVYREAGGGYAGLQAIAEAALSQEQA